MSPWRSSFRRAVTETSRDHQRNSIGGLSFLPPSGAPIIVGNGVAAFLRLRRQMGTAIWSFSLGRDRSGKNVTQSSGLCFKRDANLSRSVFGEVNAGFLEGPLYFEDGREVSF